MCSKYIVRVYLLQSALLFLKVRGDARYLATTFETSRLFLRQINRLSLISQEYRGQYQGKNSPTDVGHGIENQIRKAGMDRGECVLKNGEGPA